MSDIDPLDAPSSAADDGYDGPAELLDGAARAIPSSGHIAARHGLIHRQGH
jgi:hypothetical protein